MLQVGITGGIGAGKSTVCKAFAQLGVPVYDSDASAKAVMVEDPFVRRKMVELFGDDVYNESVFNRQLVARQMFNDEALRMEMNLIVIPRVLHRYKAWVEEQRPSKPAYIIKESALLYETGTWKEFDRIIVVTAPVEVREARVLRRDDHRSLEDIRTIMSVQFDVQEALQRADYVVVNDDSQLIIAQAMDIHNRILELTKHA